MLILLRNNLPIVHIKISLKCLCFLFWLSQEQQSVVSTSLFQCFFMALFLSCPDSVVDTRQLAQIGQMKLDEVNPNKRQIIAIFPWLAGYPLLGVKLPFKRGIKGLICLLVVYTLMLPYHLPHTILWQERLHRVFTGAESENSCAWLRQHLCPGFSAHRLVNDAPT